MNEHQYRQLCENRRTRGPLLLNEAARHARSRGVPVPPVAAVIAFAARRLRRRQQAAAAWQRVARPEWLAATEVAGCDGDTVEITVSGPTVAYELRRQSAALERALACLAPGVRRLRFVVAGQSDA